MKRKWICLAAIAFLVMSSLATHRATQEQAEPVEEPESINRIEQEDWHPDLSIVRADGSINRVRLQKEAEYVAKVLYGTAYNNTRKQQETAVWCIINRMESKWYPNSIEEVCKQRQQWMGYDPTNPIKEDLLSVAINVLTKYYAEGYKPCSNIYVYMYATGTDIVLRDTFEITPKTRYWRAENDG